MQNSLRKYQRLTTAEREEISRGLAQNKNFSEIAHCLHRSISTISREVRRNSGVSSYRAYSASRRSWQRASIRRGGIRRLSNEDDLRDYVIAKLKKRWSPGEIVKRMAEDYPDDRRMRISHEAIYQYLYVLPRGALKATLIKGLRQERKYRRKQGGRKANQEETRGKITNMLSLEERPKEVADRTIPGHWEGDLIMGKYKHTALGTLVERTTRKTILVPP